MSVLLFPVDGSEDLQVDLVDPEIEAELGHIEIEWIPEASRVIVKIRSGVDGYDPVTVEFYSDVPIVNQPAFDFAEAIEPCFRCRELLAAGVKVTCEAGHHPPLVRPRETS